jgi:hypothetical protein
LVNPFENRFPVVEIAQSRDPSQVGTGSIGYQDLGFLPEQVCQVFIFTVPDGPVVKGHIDFLVGHGLHILVFCIQGYGPEYQVRRRYHIKKFFMHIQHGYATTSAGSPPVDSHF